MSQVNFAIQLRKERTKRNDSAQHKNSFNTIFKSNNPNSRAQVLLANNYNPQFLPPMRESSKDNYKRIGIVVKNKEVSSFDPYNKSMPKYTDRVYNNA